MPLGTWMSIPANTTGPGHQTSEQCGRGSFKAAAAMVVTEAKVVMEARVGVDLVGQTPTALVHSISAAATAAMVEMEPQVGLVDQAVTPVAQVEGAATDRRAGWAQAVSHPRRWVPAIARPVTVARAAMEELADQEDQEDLVVLVAVAK